LKSGVVSCFDYRTLEIPEELTKWKISDEEIEAELKALSGDYASEEWAADQVRAGDSLRCICLAGSDELLKDRVLFLYPGRALPGAEAAEGAVLGKKCGDVLETFVGKQMRPVKLEIAGVMRRVTLPVGDELVKKLEIPGVFTVEDYYCWYREQHREERRMKAGYGIIRYWLTEMMERSEIFVDEEEKREWSLTRGRAFFEGMLASGYDLRIPSEGFEILTDEQAIEKAAKEQAERFVPFLLLEYLCRQDGYVLTKEDYEKEIIEAGAARGLGPEESKRRSEFSMYLEVRYQEHVFYGKSEEAQKKLED
jgi:hypothetical protein